VLRAAIFELDPRSGHEIPNGARRHDFIRARCCSHAGTDMDGNPREPFAGRLTLARVQADPNAES
jgi:hypothetical protein